MIDDFRIYNRALGSAEIYAIARGNSWDIRDINCNYLVNMEDFRILSQQWLKSPGRPSADIAPAVPNGVADINDIIKFAESRLEDYSQ
jgi:hypothetical protein